MTRRTLILNCKANREKAAHWALKVSDGSRVEFKAPKRSMPQNDHMWLLLTDLSTQLRWHGQSLSPEDWKLVMLDGLKREMRIVPNIDGNGFVNLGRSSSKLSKQEFSDLLELILAFGARHGVRFYNEEKVA